MAGLRFTGLMVRRLLVNWRVEVAAARRVLPEGVRPAVVGGHAVAALCLVRLEGLRPVGVPAFLGLASENVAVRMGIERDGTAGKEKSVLIFRRESPSMLNGAFCHHLGYGVHHRSDLRAEDSAERTWISGTSASHRLEVQVRAAAEISRRSVFGGMADAEAFFRGSECGYSPTRREGMWDAVRLHLHRWDLRAMAVDYARSTLMESMFGGAATVDSAFVMRDIEHTWIPCGSVELGTMPAVARGQVAMAA